MPYRPVTNCYRTKKVNAAAKYKVESLNDKLFTGSDLLQNLVGINFISNVHQIDSTVDLEAMFLQVNVPAQ